MYAPLWASEQGNQVPNEIIGTFPVCGLLSVQQVLPKVARKFLYRALLNGR